MSSSLDTSNVKVNGPRDSKVAIISHSSSKNHAIALTMMIQQQCGIPVFCWDLYSKKHPGENKQSKIISCINCIKTKVFIVLFTSALQEDTEDCVEQTMLAWNKCKESCKETVLIPVFFGDFDKGYDVRQEHFFWLRHTSNNPIIVNDSPEWKSTISSFVENKLVNKKKTSQEKDLKEDKQDNVSPVDDNASPVNKPLLYHKGVSIYHLEHIIFFTKDAAGGFRNNDTSRNSSKIDADKTIHELMRGLRKDDPSLILRKGLQVRCPRDGKMGAAYVDCLEGEDHVGAANLVLSFIWDNTIGEIVSVLRRYCQNRNLDPKRVYVWIDCLCINPHRMEDWKNGKDIPMEEFAETFKDKICKIRKVLALFSPFFDIGYLKDARSIFQLYTAITAKDCELFMEMPEGTRNGFLTFLKTEDDPNVVVNTVFAILGKTNVAGATASVESEKVNILSIVEEGFDGGCPALDIKVNQLLREWNKDLLDMFLKDVKEELGNDKGTRTEEEKDQIVNLLKNLVALFRFIHSDPVAALDCTDKLYNFCLKTYGGDHINTSFPLTNLVDIYREQGKYDLAIEYGYKALVISKRVHGTDHTETSTYYYNLGRVYDDKGNYDTALEYYNKSLIICEAKLGTQHRDTALLYHSIGAIKYQNNDLDQALEYYFKAMEIRETIAKTDNGIKPSLAATYNNIGVVYGKRGDVNKELEYYLKCMDIKEKVYKPSTPKLKLTYKNIMLTYKKLDNTEKANKYRIKAGL